MNALKWLTTLLVFVVMECSVVYAEPYWTGPLLNWNLVVNNGVIYLTATNMPSHCSYSRAQIDTAGNGGTDGVTGGYSLQNNKDLYAYLMVASSLGKQTLNIVVRREDTVCSIYGAAAN